MIAHQLSDKLLVADDFLDDASCELLTCQFAPEPHVPIQNLYHEQVQDPSASQLVASLEKAAVAACSRFYETDLVHETSILIRLNRGGGHPLHADAERLIDGRWEPNHTPNRRCAAIIFLNSLPFGRLQLPNQGLAIEPKTGLMVCFPSHARWQHGVVPLRRPGPRDTLSIWMTCGAST